MTFKPVSTLIQKQVEVIQHIESPIEQIMFWALLNSNKFVLVKDGDKPQGEGMFIFPQHKLGPYRPDFLIIARGYKGDFKVYPPENVARLIVECDGEEFHQDKDRDMRRDQYFKEKGIETMRFTGVEIYKNADRISMNIYNYLLEKVKGGSK